MLHLVIEGAGDVVDQYYYAALVKLIKEGRQFRLTFTDNRRYWLGQPSLEEKMRATKRKLQELGASSPW